MSILTIFRSRYAATVNMKIKNYPTPLLNIY